MSLLSYQEFIAARESRAITRAKTAAALGLGVMPTADVFGHSTPTPYVTKKLLGKLGDKDKKPNEPLQEKHDMHPDYSFDRLIRKASSASQEIDSDLDKAEKEADRLDKEKKEKQSKKNIPDKRNPHPPQPEEKEQENPKDKDQDQDDEQDLPTPIKKPLNPKKPVFTKKPVLTPPVKEKMPGKGNHEKLKEEAEWLFLLGNSSFTPHLPT